MALHVTNHVRPEALARQKRLMSAILDRVAQATAAPAFAAVPPPRQLYRARVRVQPRPRAADACLR